MKSLLNWFKELLDKMFAGDVYQPKKPSELKKKVVQYLKIGNKYVDKVVLHCSATNDAMSPEERHWNIDASDVDKWHKAKGWKGIGYHFFIKRDGTLQLGRKVGTYGAHTVGENDDIGVCYAGTYKPTEAQVEALKALSETIRDKYGIGPMDWHPHNEYANKICPGFDKKQIEKYLLD